MKAGWGDAPLALRDLSVSNLHVHGLVFSMQSPSSKIQSPASKPCVHSPVIPVRSKYMFMYAIFSSMQGTFSTELF